MMIRQIGMLAKSVIRIRRDNIDFTRGVAVSITMFNIKNVPKRTTRKRIHSHWMPVNTKAPSVPLFLPIPN
jgi:hypothetical protein